MKEGNEIEIQYRWSELDKQHQYFVTCRFENCDYKNYWIYWVWYRMGESFPKKLPFRLYPYENTWEETKLIAAYKTVNGNSERVPKKILSHFNKVKNKLTEQELKK